MKIQAKEYPRPTVKEILDFGASDPTDDLLMDFVSRFGYFRRVPIATKLGVGFPSHYWSGRDDEDIKHEGIEQWLVFWKDIALAQAMYSQMQGVPTGTVKLYHSGCTPNFGVYFGSHPVEPGGFCGYISKSYESKDTDIKQFAKSENTMFFIQGLAAKLVAEKRNENPPVLQYCRKGLEVVESRKETLLAYIWRIFDDLISDKNDIEARQCSECGEWEVKGEGYKRSTWVSHKSCGNIKRSIEFRKTTRKVRGEDETD